MATRKILIIINWDINFNKQNEIFIFNDILNVSYLTVIKIMKNHSPLLFIIRKSTFGNCCNQNGNSLNLRTFFNKLLHVFSQSSSCM